MRHWPRVLTRPSATIMCAVLSACASQKDLKEQMQPDAVKAAQEHGASQFACPAATAQVQSASTIEEPQGTGWYELPHRAAYIVAVSGCGKSATYSVACDDRQKGCIASVPEKTAVLQTTIAEKMQPLAIRTAQEHGSSVFDCAAVTAEVVRKEVLEEPRGTGWYEPPHRAIYSVSVSGCGKQTSYLVACDDRQKDTCTAGALQATQGSPRDLADELAPSALKVAQQQGASELECPAATPKVLREETIQEPQGTGWYEPPHRAVYTISVSGCGKRASYLVSCNKQQKACTAGRLQSAQ
jgi:hypothetical protein